MLSNTEVLVLVQFGNIVPGKSNSIIDGSVDVSDSGIHITDAEIKCFKVFKILIIRDKTINIFKI